MGEDSSPRCLVASDSTFWSGKPRREATRRLFRIWGKNSSPRCPESPLAPHRARCCAPLFGLVRSLPPAAVQRGRAQLALCVPGSPVQIGALSVSLAAWSPLRRHLVQRKGFSAWGGSLLRRVRLPHPSGESFDLRKLRPNDSPPVAVAAGLRRSQGGLAACRLGPLLPSGESFDLRRLRPNDSPPVVSAARPPRTRLVPLRFACSSNLLSVLLRRPGEQITSAR